MKIKAGVSIEAEYVFIHRIRIISKRELKDYCCSSYLQISSLFLHKNNPQEGNHKEFLKRGFLAYFCKSSGSNKAPRERFGVEGKLVGLLECLGENHIVVFLFLKRYFFRLAVWCPR